MNVQKRKPIYDDLDVVPFPSAATPVPSPASSTIPKSDSSAPMPSKPRGPTPTDRLAEQIGKARVWLYKYATKAEDAVNKAADDAFHLERSLTDTIASLAPPRSSGEKLMPGLVYVLVAGMAGSIITRRSNILLRATVPLAVGVGAGWTVIPVTMGNVSNLIWTYEKKFPAVANAHLQTRDRLVHAWQTAKAHTAGTKAVMEDKVGSARNSIEDWVKQGR